MKIMFFRFAIIFCVNIEVFASDTPKSLWPTTTSSVAVYGLHGLIYMAKDWNTPYLPPSTPVDIVASEDKARVAVIVLPSGPIYSSTNYGKAWTVISEPGTYKIPFSISADGDELYTTTTINPPLVQTATNAPFTNWYAVAVMPNGTKVAASNNKEQPAPILTITPGNQGVVVSWPVACGNFTLQENTGLDSTNWQTVTNPGAIIEGQNQVALPASAASDFFRLKSSATN